MSFRGGAGCVTQREKLGARAVDVRAIVARRLYKTSHSTKRALAL